MSKVTTKEMNTSHTEQLELFTDSPFSLRLKFSEGVRIFNDNYWCHLPYGKISAAVLRILCDFFKDHYLDTPSKADVERLRRFLKEMGYAVSTINKVHMTGSRLYSKWFEYVEGKYLNGEDVSRVCLPAKNPFALVPRVSEKRFARTQAPTKEEVRRLVSYADDDLKDQILGLYWTTLRPSDFYRLTAANVNFKMMILEGIQNKTITTKNPSGNPYRIPFFLDFARILKGRIERTKPGTPLFLRTNLKKRFYLARNLAGLRWIEIGRDLRRAGATYLLDHGVDPYTVAALLGHSTLEMLPRYTPRTDKHLIEAAEKLVEV